MKLNGTEIPAQKLEKGWQTINVELPEGALRAENVLHIKFGNMGRYNKKLGGGALAFMQVGPSPLEDTAVQALSGLPMAQDDLTLAPEQGLAWHIWAQPEAKIAMTIAGSAGCGIEAKLFSDDASGKLVASHSQEIVLVEG